LPAHRHLRLFVGDKIIVSWGCLLAMDAKDGRTLWKAADAQSAYGTPAIAKIGNDTIANSQGGNIVRLNDGESLCAGQFRTAYTTPLIEGHVLYGNGNLEWNGFNGSLVPIGDKLVLFYWQGGNPAIPAWAKTSVTDKMQVFAYSALTGKVLWKFEETCPPGTRGPGLIAGGGLPLVFQHEDCLVIHGNRQWKILRRADGKQVWNWECSGPQEAPAWANGGLRPVGNNRYLDALNGWQLALVSSGSKLQQIAERILDRCELSRSQGAQSAGQLVAVKTGQALHVDCGCFGKPARLAEQHFAALPANRRRERRDDDQGTGIVGLRIGQDQDRPALLGKS
jgi:hypothetical protein